jgi:hypothetical protein
LREKRTAPSRTGTKVGASPRFVLDRANSTAKGVSTFRLRPTIASSISHPGSSISEPKAKMPIDGFKRTSQVHGNLSAAPPVSHLSGSRIDLDQVLLPECPGEHRARCGESVRPCAWIISIIAKCY